MFRIKYAFLAVLCLLNLIDKCENFYPKWGRHKHKVQSRTRHLLWKLERDLIRDAWQKSRSVENLKTFYSKAPSFHVAERIFFIRRKFARMMRVYTDAHGAIGKSDIHDFTKQMLEIQQLSMDIDHLVEMLTEWELDPDKGMIEVGGFKFPESFLSLGKGMIPGLPGGKFPGGLPDGKFPRDFPGGKIPEGMPSGPPGHGGAGGGPRRMRRGRTTPEKW